MHRQFKSIALIVAVLASAALAIDWPQWRGPNRDNISPETGLLKEPQPMKSSPPKPEPSCRYTLTFESKESLPDESNRNTPAAEGVIAYQSVCERK